MSERATDLENQRAERAERDRQRRESLPPFSGDEPTCVKCGNIGATTRYLYPGYIHRSTGQTGECLIRECGRCDYSWAERTLKPAERPTT